MPHKDEIVQRFANAGWEIDDGFDGHLVIGYSGDTVSVVTHAESYDDDNPLFELLDHVRDVTYWVKEIPSPDRAKTLLEEHGKPPEEWVS